MRSPTTTLLRQVTRGPNEPLNILTCPTHESSESMLALTGHQFYGWEAPGGKRWNPLFRPVPSNYYLFGKDSGDFRPPAGVDFDAVLVQNRFSQYPILSQIANELHLPLIILEHTQAYASWTARQLAVLTAMKGHQNVFITKVSQEAWGFSDKDSVVIEHGIDTGLFAPKVDKRRAVALSVVNQWAERDEPCGYRFWLQATAGLPVMVLGDNPGLSKPAANPQVLAEAYASAAVFVNTSLISPVPTALLEAMASGCICISTDTCQIPDVIQDGVTGLLCSSPAEMRATLGEVLADPEGYEILGRNAREYVSKRYGIERFVAEWNAVFQTAAGTPFLKRLN